MNYVALGVIGHVDHGKTALVKALSGVDTDRLREEKDRGISIALGYAHLTLPDGELGIVDAPGHEKFVRTMVAGATAIEAVLLVVDVNEGVKPQTVEHLDIAELMGIERGVIAVTKCDTAEPTLAELAAEEIRELVQDTFLAEAPIILTSAKSGHGCDELKEVLNTIVRESAPLCDEGAAYLPVDRVFSMKGFGTVVTGTLRRGALRVGDKVAIYPAGKTATVRELQSHNAFVEELPPGRRTAVNLRGVEKADLQRGDVLATPDTLSPGSYLDVELRLLPNAPNALKHNQRVRVLFGTKETYARAHLLDRSELVAGESCAAQFRCNEPVAALNLEPYIIRTYSPMRTIGGGRILNVGERRYRKRDETALRRLRAFGGNDPAAIVEEAVRAAGMNGISRNTVARDRRLDSGQVVDALTIASVVETAAGRLVHHDHENAARERVLDIVRRFHAEKPTQPGIPAQRLTDELADTLDARRVEELLDALTADNTLASEKGLVRDASFSPEGALSDVEKRVAEEMEQTFLDAGLQPPDTSAVVQDDQTQKKVYQYLLDNKTLVVAGGKGGGKVQNGAPGGVSRAVVFHTDAVDKAKSALQQRFENGAPFAVADAKAVLGLSRKYMIPLLEYLDATGFTRRVEAGRVITRR